MHGDGQVISGSKEFMSCFPKYYLAKGGYTWNKRRRIDAVTLDDIMRNYFVPDLLVLDCEGMEYQILKSCHSMPKVVIVETHEGDIRWWHQDWVKENIRKIDSLFVGWSKEILDECNTRYESSLYNKT